MKKLVVLFILFFNCIIFASSQQLNTNNLCKNLTGTWIGLSKDQQRLFYNGGPWRTDMQVYYQNGRFIGTINTTNKNVPPNHTYIWGKCQKGKLSDIYILQSPKLCGKSSTGKINPDHTLEINFNWENPNGMAGTLFDIHLMKGTNVTQRYTNVTFLQEYLQGKPLPRIKSCF